ncbi:50S ribosomal protein L32 [Shimazuella alba]|jgi:large subunit ribosomal protein L32|uniref:Large ribosomal subunit protein bL32 n=1 Tax=Shimazuella alba TaxID=2690964 RepID=A0A6I4VS36_9BACL|nr:50S ribosomal protein L32 [Shimazuella alba]MXQ53241.1 50S ribosomal protein L32 [Shimazuella alba]
MAVPFRRTSKTRKRMRRTHFKLKVAGMSTCKQCDAPKLAHHVCKECGYYDGAEVEGVVNK